MIMSQNGDQLKNEDLNHVLESYDSTYNPKVYQILSSHPLTWYGLKAIQFFSPNPLTTILRLRNALTMVPRLSNPFINPLSMTQRLSNSFIKPF